MGGEQWEKIRQNLEKLRFEDKDLEVEHIHGEREITMTKAKTAQGEEVSVGLFLALVLVHG